MNAEKYFYECHVIPFHVKMPITQNKGSKFSENGDIQLKYNKCSIYIYAVLEDTFCWEIPWSFLMLLYHWRVQGRWFLLNPESQWDWHPMAWVQMTRSLRLRLNSSLALYSMHVYRNHPMHMAMLQRCRKQKWIHHTFFFIQLEHNVYACVITRWRIYAQYTESISHARCFFALFWLFGFPYLPIWIT